MDFEAELPSSTVALLDLYLERYRPLLLDGPSSWLFPGRQNGPKSEQAIRSQIQTCVATKCGVKVNPHLFRHIAAKIHLDSNPGAYGFTNASATCLTGNVVVGGTVCANPGSFVFWDSLHPTTAAHRVLGDAFDRAVPEPATLTLVGFGMAMAIVRRRLNATSL